MRDAVEMRTNCPSCSSKIQFPKATKLVKCPSCDQVFETKNLGIEKRAWKIAITGLVLCFHYFILSLFSPVLDSTDINFFVVLILLNMIGIPIALYGLLLVIVEKVNRKNKFIILESIGIIMVLYNAYLIFTIGAIV
mgnify:FL=1